MVFSASGQAQQHFVVRASAKFEVNIVHLRGIYFSCTGYCSRDILPGKPTTLQCWWHNPFDC